MNKVISLCSIICLLSLNCENNTRLTKKNIMMIIVDDMRPIIDNEKFNFPKTPNIKRLEKRGTSFTRAYAQYAKILIEIKILFALKDPCVLTKFRNPSLF